MNGLLGIWLVMRVVSFALLTFVLVFMVGGHGWAATGRAITFMEPGLLVEARSLSAYVRPSGWPGALPPGVSCLASDPLKQAELGQFIAHLLRHVGVECFLRQVRRGILRLEIPHPWKGRLGCGRTGTNCWSSTRLQRVMPSVSSNGSIEMICWRQLTMPLITQYNDPFPTISSARFGTIRVV
jgi:hypothetical protein